MPELSQFKAEFFKALAHPLRIGIIDALRGGEGGVNKLSTAVSAAVIVPPLALMAPAASTGSTRALTSRN
jgi:DNA-binding transcriptional ArsR family regulator